MNSRAVADPGIRVTWMSLGELSRLIETFQVAGVRRAVMAGQVKHLYGPYVDPLPAES